MLALGLKEPDFNRDIELPLPPIDKLQKNQVNPVTQRFEPFSGGIQWDTSENVWQDWFPPGTYANWGGWGGVDFDLPQMKQVWWRSPEWGGGIVWHPYWGWQDKETVKKLYLESPGPVTWEQFIRWPLQRNLGSDWRTYFPDRVVETGGGGGGFITIGDWQAEPIPRPSPVTGSSNNQQSGWQIPENLDLMSIFGYTGPIGINPYEQQALDFISELYGNRLPLQTLNPATQFYNWALGGGFSPLGKYFTQNVIDATRQNVMANLQDAQRLLSENFAHRGGYFGGAHAIAQSNLAQKILRDLDEQIANLYLQGYGQDIATRMGAVQGLTNIAPIQANVMNQILSGLLTGGQLLTNRELLNRAEYQNALQRVYEDWLRARQESMLPFNMALSLLGVQAFQPVGIQRQMSPWGSLLGALGTGLGYAFGGSLGGFLGNRVGNWFGGFF